MTSLACPKMTAFGLSVKLTNSHFFVVNKCFPFWQVAGSGSVLLAVNAQLLQDQPYLVCLYGGMLLLIKTSPTLYVSMEACSSL